jgi:aryl-alcohol dehydrogenase-like predicted oxidoreductase
VARVTTANPTFRRLGSTELSVFPLCLGGNVFGWTADEEASFAVLDAYVAAGGNFIDTANGYSRWVPGHDGGESERVIGNWIAARGNRDDVIIATKLGSDGGLGPENVRARAEESLERLKTDVVDIMYAHYDDLETPPEVSLAALDELVREGKVRHLAASNFAPERLEEALGVAEREGFATYEVLQPHYNLLEREYETGLGPVAERHGLATAPYFGLAKGFLTGKYRGDAKVDSPRAAQVGSYDNERGWAVVDAVEEIAAAHGVPAGAVALAWLAAQPTVVAPIASARTTEQLEDLLPMATLELSDDELGRLTEAGR